MYVPKINMIGSTHTVKAKSETGNIWMNMWQHKKVKAERKSARDLRNLM